MYHRKVAEDKSLWSLNMNYNFGKNLILATKSSTCNYQQNLQANNFFNQIPNLLIVLESLNWESPSILDNNFCYKEFFMQWENYFEHKLVMIFKWRSSLRKREIQLRSLVWKTYQQSIDIRCKVWKIVRISFSYQDHPESNFFMIFL